MSAFGNSPLVLGGNSLSVASGTSPVGTTGITVGQVAYGATVANTIKGEAAFLYTEATDILQIGAATGTHLLLGTATNSSNGALQLATHTTSAGGIGFGTDNQLFRVGGGNIRASVTTGATDMKLSLATNQRTANALTLNDSSGALELDNGGAFSLLLKTNATTALTLDSSQNATFVGAIKESTDTRSGPGAVSVTKTTTKVTTTGALDALTLADGTDGQVKRIIHDVDGGSFVLTPTTKTGWSTFTSTAVGESITLQFVTTRGWIVIANYLGTIAP